MKVTANQAATEPSPQGFRGAQRRQPGVGPGLAGRPAGAGQAPLQGAARRPAASEDLYCLLEIVP